MIRPCIVVAGMGRCGTSLMMQMLEAAGVPCVGTWPDFETQASEMGTFDALAFAARRDQAIKLIDPANLGIREIPDHVVIWMDRDPRQQARSQAKLLSLTLGRLSRSAVRHLESNLRKTRNKHRAAIGLPGGSPGIIVRFEDLISTANVEAGRVCGFLAENGWYGLNAAKMAAQVRYRPTNCLTGFLESTLIQFGRSAA